MPIWSPQEGESEDEFRARVAVEKTRHNIGYFAYIWLHKNGHLGEETEHGRMPTVVHDDVDYVSPELVVVRVEARWDKDGSPRYGRYEVHTVTMEFDASEGPAAFLPGDGPPTVDLYALNKRYRTVDHSVEVVAEGSQ